MKIDKTKPFVEIEIQDWGKYLDVALLVDKPEFRKIIPILRKKYELDTHFPALNPKQAYRDFFIKMAEDITLKKRFENDVEKIRRRFHRPTHFTIVISKAIVTGVVNEYASAYLEEQVLYPSKNPVEEPPEETKYAIVVSPITKKADVDKVFSDFLRRIKKNYSVKKENPAYGWFFEPRIYTDTKDNIEQDRVWYRKREEGTKPLQLALIDCKLTYKEYGEMLLKDKQNKKLTDEESERIVRYLNRVEKAKVRIKAQLRRYRRLLERY